MWEWVARQGNFYGSYEARALIMAIAKLLQHGINTNDPCLTEITVRGDLVHSSMGRATAKPEQWTKIPLLAKLLKLIVNEMQNDIEEVGINLISLSGQRK